MEIKGDKLFTCGDTGHIYKINLSNFTVEMSMDFADSCQDIKVSPSEDFLLASLDMSDTSHSILSKINTTNGDFISSVTDSKQG